MSMAFWKENGAGLVFSSSAEFSESCLSSKLKNCSTESMSFWRVAEDDGAEDAVDVAAGVAGVAEDVDDAVGACVNS